jgi:hypothetical protein
VTASTIVGESEPSEEVSTTTDDEDPSPPVNVVAENVTSRTVVVLWDPPVEPNGVILNYTVTFRGIDSPNPVGRDFHQSRTESTVIPSAMLTGLIPGSTYNISVTASTIVGESEPSEEVSTTTDDEDPSPPVNVVAENVTSRTVVVLWDPPVEPNGVILNYTVTFRGIDSPNPVGRDFHQSRTESTVVTSAMLTGLIPGSTYNISVTASTIVGESEPSEEVSTTTDDEDPSPPVNVVAENVTSRTVVVLWDPPVEPNGVILNYTVTFRGIDSPNPVGRDFHQSRTESTVVTSAMLTGLIPGSTYNISVTASTTAGESEPSKEVSTTTDDEVPTAPARPNITDVLPTSFLVLWSPPTEPNGVIVSYQVTYTGIETLNGVDSTFFESSVVTLDGPFEQTEITGLVPFSNYSVSVAAFTSAGSGSPSESVMIGTAPSAPSAPRNLTAVNITTNRFVVEWIVPADPNGPVFTYNVEIRVGESVLKAENTSQEMLAVTGLDPVVKHTINICAYTIACGNVSTFAVQTSGVPPQVAPVQGIDSLSVNRMDNFSVSFKINLPEPPVSRDNITWTVTTSSGQQILNCTNTTKYTFSLDCLSVNISNAEQTDGGSYAIVAVTRAGTGSSTVSVSIRGVPPTITAILSDSSAVSGSSHVIVCTAVADPVPAFGWRFNENLIQLNPAKHIISSNATHSVLTVLDLALSDGGTYTCSASNRYGGDSTSANLTILFPPVLTSSPQSNRDVVLGEELVVSCSAEGRPDPEIVWQMSSTVLTSGGDVVISSTSNGRSELRIRSFTRSNSGEYSCTATNTFGNVSASFRVNLIVRPNITGVNAVSGSVVTPLTHNGQLTRTEFANLSLTCTASGEPPPEIVWLLDGTVLSTDSRRSVVSTLSYSNLTISELQLSDAGTYTCRATSGNVSPIPGQTTVNVQLNVPSRDECLSNPCQNGGVCTDGIGDFFCNCLSNQTLIFSGKTCNQSRDESTLPRITTQPVGRTDYKLFETVTLTCTAEGNPDPVITWYKDGVALQGPQSVGEVYTIDRISPGDRGAYHCEATNFRGRATSNSARVLIEGIVQFRVEVTDRQIRRKRQTINQMNSEELQSLAVGQQLRGTGNVTAEIVSLVQVPNSTEFIVTVNTNSTQSPQQLTQIITQPLTEQFEEYSDILQTVSFVVQSTERHDGCPMEVSSSCSDAATVVWPETEIDQVAIVPCPCGSEGAPQSVATRRCGGNYVDGAEWDPQMCTQCQFPANRVVLCDLLEEPSISRVTNILANITEDSANIESEDVTLTSLLLDRVTFAPESMSSGQVEEEATQVVGEFFSTVNNLIDVDNNELRSSNEQSGSVNRVVTTFDRVANELALFPNITNGTNTFTQTFSNFAVQIIEPPEDSNSSFSPDLSSLVMAANSMSGMDSSNEQIVTANVTLPANLNSFGSRLVFAVFLQSSLYPTDANSTSVGGIIVSASVANLTVENLTNPVEFVFEKNNLVRMTPNQNQNLSCVFWDEDINDIRGGWSTEGCVLVRETEDVVVCECDHLTSFSMLLDVLPAKPVDPILPPEFLASVTYIGCSLSVIALIITVVTYLGDKKLRGHLHRQLLISLCFALLGLYITFIITNAVSSYPDILPSIRPICGLLSALLHYFFLVTFLAMAAIAINLYRKLVVVFNADIPSYLPIAILICWVVPIFIVGFSIAPHYQYYTGEVIPGETIAYCRAQSWPFYFGLILPFGVIYIFNIALFVIILGSLIRRPNVQKEAQKAGQLKRLKENFWVSVGLFVLFGVSWVFGMLATAGLPNYIRIGFDVIFTILASLQGLFVFLLYCLKSPECRRLWMDWLHCRFTQASRTTTSSSGHNRRKSSQGASTLRGTRSTRINSIPRPSLVATLNSRIFNQFNRKNENIYTSTNYSSSVMSPPPFELARKDDPHSLPEKKIHFDFEGIENNYVEKISFNDNFSENSFYFGMDENGGPNNDCTVVVNEDAFLGASTEHCDVDF